MRPNSSYPARHLLLQRHINLQISRKEILTTSNFVQGWKMYIFWCTEVCAPHSVAKRTSCTLQFHASYKVMKVMKVRFLPYHVSCRATYM